MQIKFLNLFLLCMTISTLSQATIRIVCTTALADAHYELRKHQYLIAFGKLIELGYTNFYIIEALKKEGPSFLDTFSPHVFYATVNNPLLRNQGINEAKTLLEGCAYFNFEPDDIIIKLTGRHCLASNTFLKIVEQNPQADAIIRINSDGNVFTVGFAMKYKYLQEMYTNIDYEELDRNMTPIEYRVGDYIKRKKAEGNFKIMYVDILNIKISYDGSSTAPHASGTALY